MAWTVAYVAGFLVVGALFASGLDYYRTPLIERAHHEGYWTWKAGGSVGTKLGIIGSSMMVLMLVYSLRKRVAALRRLGALSRWLDVHIFLGVFGPLLVVLHSGFKVQGVVALSFWSMIIVASSGVLGRYLYLQIPRTRAGEALALAEFARGCRGVPRPLYRDFERAVQQKALVRRRILLWDRAHELFHYWHVMHKPFALVMYLFMVVHVAVAVMTGYAWGSGP